MNVNPGQSSMDEPTQRAGPSEDPPVADTELVRQAKAGDLAAFEALAVRHERAIFSLARRILQDEHEAEDVTQQTFLSALEHLQGFREEASVGTWLQRIATHAALKVIRKRRGLKTTSLEAALAPEEGYEGIRHPEYIADWSQSPEELAMRHETRQLIEQALARLEEKHRLVFLLRDVEGLSVRETAQALEISEANVKVRLLRARLRLREELTRAFGDPGRRIHTQPHLHE
jgi:RNA polymerase sigma-70 factor, ECF subfamily